MVMILQNYPGVHGQTVISSHEFNCLKKDFFGFGSFKIWKTKIGSAGNKIGSFLLIDMARAVNISICWMFHHLCCSDKFTCYPQRVTTKVITPILSRPPVGGMTNLFVTITPKGVTTIRLVRFWRQGCGVFRRIVRSRDRCVRRRRLHSCLRRRGRPEQERRRPAGQGFAAGDRREE